MNRPRRRHRRPRRRAGPHRLRRQHPRHAALDARRARAAPPTCSRVIDQPGPIEVESVVSTEWAVTRAGLINLDAPKAKAAGLTDGDEPIEVFFHVVRHPRFGTFIIDTGVERALRDAPDEGRRARPRRELHAPREDGLPEAARRLARRPARAAPRRLLHAPAPRSRLGRAGPAEEHADLRRARRDHGARVPPPLHAGHHRSRARRAARRSSEWRYQPDPDGRFAGVVDVFGDGSFWALWTPGHTPGSTAYLARTAARARALHRRHLAHALGLGERRRARQLHRRPREERREPRAPPPPRAGAPGHRRAPRPPARGGARGPRRRASRPDGDDLGVLDANQGSGATAAMGARSPRTSSFSVSAIWAASKMARARFAVMGASGRPRRCSTRASSARIRPVSGWRLAGVLLGEGRGRGGGWARLARGGAGGRERGRTSRGCASARGGRAGASRRLGRRQAPRRCSASS